jgi:hypothetical protein
LPAEAPALLSSVATCDSVPKPEIRPVISRPDCPGLLADTTPQALNSRLSVRLDQDHVAEHRSTARDSRTARPRIASSRPTLQASAADPSTVAAHGVVTSRR